MVIIFSILIAALIVAGQALWKAAVAGAASHHVQLISAAGLQYLLKSPKLYMGALIYGLATVGYIILLSKFKYFQVQSIVVGGSLILTLFIAHLFFHEQMNLANIVGVALLVSGLVLVSR